MKNSDAHKDSVSAPTTQYIRKNQFVSCRKEILVIHFNIHFNEIWFEAAMEAWELINWNCLKDTGRRFSPRYWSGGLLSSAITVSVPSILRGTRRGIRISNLRHRLAHQLLSQTVVRHTITIFFLPNKTRSISNHRNTRRIWSPWLPINIKSLEIAIVW